MLSKTLKKTTGKLLKPIGETIGKIGIRPNLMTIAT
jgi:hypothetical protein